MKHHGDGTIELMVNGQTGGFEDLSCTRGGQHSANSVTIYAMHGMQFDVIPDRFQLNTPTEMRCDFTVRPRTDVGFEASIDHTDLEGKTRKLAKIVYQQNSKNNEGTVLEDAEVYSDYLKVEALSNDEAQLALKVTALSDKARGSYQCTVDLNGNIHGLKEWQTGEAPSTPQPTTVPPQARHQTTAAPKPTAGPQRQNSGSALATGLTTCVTLLVVLLSAVH